MAKRLWKGLARKNWVRIKNESLLTAALENWSRAANVHAEALANAIFVIPVCLLSKKAFVLAIGGWYIQLVNYNLRTNLSIRPTSIEGIISRTFSTICTFGYVILSFAQFRRGEYRRYCEGNSAHQEDREFHDNQPRLWVRYWGKDLVYRVWFALLTSSYMHITIPLNNIALIIGFAHAMYFRLKKGP